MLKFEGGFISCRWFWCMLTVENSMRETLCTKFLQCADLKNDALFVFCVILLRPNEILVTTFKLSSYCQPAWKSTCLIRFQGHTLTSAPPDMWISPVRADKTVFCFPKQFNITWWFLALAFHPGLLQHLLALEMFNSFIFRRRWRCSSTSHTEYKFSWEPVATKLLHAWHMLSPASIFTCKHTSVESLRLMFVAAREASARGGACSLLCVHGTPSRSMPCPFVLRHRCACSHCPYVTHVHEVKRHCNVLCYTR